jgi:KDO2-lipid IV(A) lauroyltransferase
LLRRLRRRVLFLVMRWVLRRTGFDGARRLGPWLSRVHYRLGRRTRRRCLAGLAAFLGRDPADPAVAAILREGYRVNTTAVLEVLSMVDRRLDAARLQQLCRVDGIANLEAARTGRGAILLATHAGNSLLLAAQLADAGWPVTIVYRQAPMMSRRFFVEGLPRYGFEGILANEGFRAYARMLDSLRANRVLFAMIDQGVERRETGLPLRFVGKDMPMPGGVVQLARQSRAPIVPITTLAADPLWHFAIEPQLVLPPGGSIEEDTAAILRHVEDGIRARPQLWSWPHRRWRNFPVAPA